ncbi:MAG TPA: class I SAM-dependent methyltransferase [Baekduia sp.]|jgi:ubiquinone/menaquinone biosynthesis C-methylase UbiE|nr:class I SAM-dependent methyltransferase [Baekduia sp.]
MPGFLAKWQTGDTHLRAPLQIRQYEEIADRVAAERHERVLDWGCGYGQITALLAARGVNVVSYEWREDAPPTSAEVRMDAYPEFTVSVSSDPVKLPYPDDAFDAALSVGVLEHVQDPDGSLAELARVLKPGGRLYVFNLPNRTSWTERLARRIGAYYHGQLPFDQVYTQRSARERLQRHGYTVTDERMTGMLPQSVPVPIPPRAVGPLWRLNQLLARIPGLNRIATAVELTGHRPAR